jgi:HK97 family phage major capsid protein
MTFEEVSHEMKTTLTEFRGYVDEQISATNRRMDNIQAILERPGLPGTRGGSVLNMALDNKQLLRPDQKISDVVREELPDGIKANEIDLARVFKGIGTGNWKGAEAERRIMTLKSLGESPDSAGGYVLPDLVGATIYDLARPVSTFIRAGALTMPITDGRYALPKLTQDPSGVWKNENSPGTFSDMLFGRTNINPRTLVVLVRASVELFEDAPALAGFINATFANAIASEIDRVAYLGNGASEPLGLWNAPGVNSVAGGGDLATYDKFLDAAQSIYEANYPGEYSGLSVIMPPRTKTALAKIVTGINGDKTSLVPPREFQDMKKFATTQASVKLGASADESMVMVGDFTQAVLVVRTGVTIEATRVGAQGTNSAFTDLQVWLRAYVRVDTAAIRPAFFSKITGVTN